MNYDLFHTIALVDNHHQISALIDSGSSAFPTISQKWVKILNLTTGKISPKVIRGFFNNISGLISKVASFSLNIGGLQIEKVWRCVVPNQGEDVILGIHDWNIVM